MHRFRRTRLRRTIWKKLQGGFRVCIKTAFTINHLVALLFLIILIWTEWAGPNLPPPPRINLTPEILSETLLVVKMDGPVADRFSMDVHSEGRGTENVQTRQGIVNTIRKAIRDPRIIAMLLNIREYDMSLSTALEIREELIKFRRSGKKLFAYMDVAGMQTYFLVSPADKIYMPPSGDIYLQGLRAEIPFYKKLFDKLGISPEFVYIGKYKTAPQIFTMDRMSQEYREVMNAILEEYYTVYVQQIADTRHVDRDQVKTWIDGGIYSANEALKNGLIDALVYENQLDEKLQVELGLQENEEGTTKKEPIEREHDEKQKPELHKINHREYTRVKIKVPGLYQKGEKIAIVYARGTIVPGESTFPSSRNPRIGSESMTELLAALAEDDEIKGIILRIHSGGGSARASDIIRHAVEETRQKKPVVVSMADVAASGGYMIAAPADSIVAYPLTLTGSIGIFGGKFSLRGLHDLIGINIEAVQRGKNAGIFTKTRTFKKTEHERFRQHVQEGYDEFISEVAQGRQMALHTIEAVAQGRIWTGKQALQLGLVDRLGGMDTAVEVIKEKLGFSEDDDVQLIEYPALENSPKPLFRFWETQVDLNLPDEIVQLQGQLAELAVLQHEHLFAWWPYRIIVE